jgi:hypothetical protein
MAVFSTDKYALGAAGAPTGVYPQIIPFSTANAPGANIPASQDLGTSDLIGLFYVPTPGRLGGYSIDIGDLDGSAALVFVLEDGQGNVYQSGITTGQAGGRLTDATAIANRVGQILYTSAASAYLRLRPSTGAGAQAAAEVVVNGVALVKHE